MTVRRVLPWLTLLALVLQAAIPIGLMPDAAGLRLVICDGTMSTMGSMKDMAMPTQMPVKPADHRKALPCPYAMAAAFLYFFVACLALMLLASTRDGACKIFVRQIALRRLSGGNSCRGPPRHIKRI